MKKAELKKQVDKRLALEGYNGWTVAEGGILSQATAECIELVDPKGDRVMSHQLPKNVAPIQHIVAKAINEYFNEFFRLQAEEAGGQSSPGLIAA